MAWRLDQVLVGGFLNNTRRNSVEGWLLLHRTSQPILLSLTGNCQGRLGGRYLRFRARPVEHAVPARIALQPHQVGPVGRIELHYIEQGQGPCRIRLDLEWFSQDGQVRTELWDPTVEFMERIVPTSGQVPFDPRDRVVEDDAQGFDDWWEDLAGHVLEPLEEDPADALWGHGVLRDEDCGPQDPSSSDVDQVPWGEPAAWSHDDASYGAKVDEVTEGRRDVPLDCLFDPPIQLKPVDALTDEEVSAEFFRLLAQLAKYGIALDMCEHFEVRDAYRLLVERVLKEEDIHPDLPGIGFVRHYMTHEYCEQCQS